MRRVLADGAVTTEVCVACSAPKKQKTEPSRKMLGHIEAATVPLLEVPDCKTHRISVVQA
ncbi:MAG: hypothetical protein QGH20_04405 [Candidatus Latescibacteria bacterium]|jgi:hypothetical protein|nr:hypothetical protein [Candidatus Latescibacterota bacterium]